MSTVGCDPEFFLTVGDDVVISPALLEHKGIIKFVTDDEKHPSLIETKDYKFHMDGVAVELGLKRGCQNSSEMYRLLNDALDNLKEYLYGLDYEGQPLNLTIKPVVNINPEPYLRLLDIPRIYQGFIFGCDRDWDIFNSNYNCVTMDVKSHPFRYGGGHVHLGGTIFHELYRPALMFSCIFLGNFFVKNSIYPDLDRQRVSTYGRPGRYRLQKYSNGDVGLEYRSPSNSWTLFNEDKFKEMDELIAMIEVYLQNERKGMQILNDFLEPSKNAIVNYDQDLANIILREVIK